MKSTILNEFSFINNNEAVSFHEYTKLKKFIKDKKSFVAPSTWTATQYKGYPRFKKIKLPKPDKLNAKAFDAILRERKSVREYSKTPISLKDLSTLLFFSAGIKDNSKDTENRFYPSAGSRYPLEVYILVQNCEGLKKGIYHYHLKTHSLEFLWPFKNQDVKNNFKHEWVKYAPFVLVITGIFYRNMIKYGDRGYRHILMESGILTENFYLTATAIGMGCCSMGGFIDEGLEKMLDIDMFEEKVLTCMTVGYK